MKDSEFIELLNLYLDHEISSVDAARLEAAVQSNPERRRVYQEYCRMQKACVVLAQQTMSDADLPERNVVVPFEPRRSWGFGSYAAGLGAAAACVALVFVVSHPISDATANHQAPATAQTNLAAAPVTHNEPQPRAIARTINVTPRSTELKSVFTARALAFDGAEPESAGSAFLTTTDNRFDWMNRVNVSSVSRVTAEELVFEAKASQLPENVAFRSHGQSQAQVETTAFQFQR